MARSKFVHRWSGIATPLGTARYRPVVQKTTYLRAFPIDFEYETLPGKFCIGANLDQRWCEYVSRHCRQTTIYAFIKATAGGLFRLLWGFGFGFAFYDGIVNQNAHKADYAGDSIQPDGAAVLALAQQVAANCGG